jgi:hypothetical protein
VRRLCTSLSVGRRSENTILSYLPKTYKAERKRKPSGIYIDMERPTASTAGVFNINGDEVDPTDFFSESNAESAVVA